MRLKIQRLKKAKIMSKSGKKSKLWLALASLALALAMTLASCGNSEPPADEGEVIAAAKTLLESAVEVNRIFFWGGLAHDEVPESAIDMGDAVYAELSGDAKYISQSELMEKVRGVYTKSYSDDIEKVAFEGVNVSEDTALLARYVSEAGVMKINVAQAEAGLPERIPDTETVRLSGERESLTSNTAIIVVEAECGGERQELTVKMKLEADGWRLDTPTY